MPSVMGWGVEFNTHGVSGTPLLNPSKLAKDTDDPVLRNSKEEM